MRRPPSTVCARRRVPFFIDADSDDYLLADHMERLRYTEKSPPKEEVDLITAVLRTVLPGLESFVTDERYAVLLGKMAYNAFGVTFGERRDGKVGVIL